VVLLQRKLPSRSVTVRDEGRAEGGGVARYHKLRPSCSRVARYKASYFVIARKAFHWTGTDGACERRMGRICQTSHPGDNFVWALAGLPS
jgi:hypothetical protein